MRYPFLSAIVLTSALTAAGAQDLARQIDTRTAAVLPKVVAWRRDIHQHPELSNREVRTSKLVADHLRALGLEVQTGVAKTGVVGLLRGGRPGKVVALRADMDALPITEMVNVPFKSVEKSTYNGQEVGVMHACGHDAHVAMLMGVAEVLAGLKDQIAGSVKFIFQPAEEGAPPGETGGAVDMIAAGVLENPKVDAIFGLHVMPFEQSTLWVRPGGLMASSDTLTITVHGKSTHGAVPWGGVDPIAVSAQVVTALQTIVSRQIDLTTAPAIITIGRINGGVRFNIIPDTVVMEGTIRTLDSKMQDDIHARITRTAKLVAESAGAEADVQIVRTTPVTFNDPSLTAQMTPTLTRVAGGKVFDVPPRTIAEDFALFQQKVPGMFFFLGINAAGADPSKVAANHSATFSVDEGALPAGIRALANLAIDYLSVK
ncbi:MAG: amidohydrolase [Acidobacteriota bacterium]